MNEPLFTAPTPPTFAEIVGRDAMMALRQYDLANRKGIDSIWRDPRGRTPQQMFDLLGNKAARIVAGSAATTQHIAAQFALAGIPYTPPALPVGATLVLNEDGTVTATLPPKPPRPGSTVVTGAPGVEVVG